MTIKLADMVTYMTIMRQTGNLWHDLERFVWWRRDLEGKWHKFLTDEELCART